uniref:Uncharacterized protein n=1 Tax=Panagrolaimus superbus TaxID=310955 RepID=A0A914Z4F7_9BILA
MNILQVLQDFVDNLGVAVVEDNLEGQGLEVENLVFVVVVVEGDNCRILVEDILVAFVVVDILEKDILVAFVAVVGEGNLEGLVGDTLVVHILVAVVDILLGGHILEEVVVVVEDNSGDLVVDNFVALVLVDRQNQEDLACHHREDLVVVVDHHHLQVHVHLQIVQDYQASFAVLMPQQNNVQAMAKLVESTVIKK